jgi:hypothetical protein
MCLPQNVILTPPNVTFTNITATSAVVNWSPLAASATYQLQWRKVGDPTWIGPINLPNHRLILLLSGYTLTPYTQYEVQVRNICVIQQHLTHGLA